MKSKKIIFGFVAVIIMAFGFMSCNNDGKDIVVKETDYAQVFLDTFEEKLSLLFHTAERDLRSGNHDFELLFKNAYLEVLGDYADVNVFLEASNRTFTVQTRSSAEETLFMSLATEVIDSSETMEDAIGKFGNLANDASLDLEDRVGFVSVREFLSFYKNNETDLIYIIIGDSEGLSEDEIEARWGRRLWRCWVNTRLRDLEYTALGCLYGLAFGSAAGVKGMLVGCAIGGLAGSVYGTVTGIQDYCLGN
jgi:hypothetical protein